MTRITQELVNFVVKIKFGDLPESAVHATKRILLDSIGCALGSFVLPKARIILDFVEELGGKPQASIIGNGKTSWALAAFTNGELINALDYDILGPFGGHVVPYVISPSLAIGERVNASGKDLIKATALAMEVGGRVWASLARHRILKEEPPYWEYSERWSYSPTIFGGVAGACNLLHLNEEKLMNAFGIGGTSTPVPGLIKHQQNTGPGIMTKYNCWAGWIAQLGTVAALLAEKGLTGDPDVLDGEKGFWKIIGSPFFKVDTLLGGLGEVWHLSEAWFKAYPCCAANQTYIDVINKIMQDNELVPEDIESILIEGEPHLLTPLRMGNKVANFVNAQFNNIYLAAVAVYHGRNPGPAWQATVTLEDKRIRDLMKKVQVVVHPKRDEIINRRIKAGEFPIFSDVAVEITAKGKRFRAEAIDARGSANNPMTDEEVAEKFRNNASYSKLTTDATEKAIEMVYGLDKVTNMTDLMKLLTIE